jgi:MFS family permease
MHPTRALVAGVLHVVGGVLPGFLIASLTPRIDADFAYSASALGATVAIFYVVCALLSSPSGHVVERIGARRAMLAGAATTVGCCLGVAALADSVGALVALLLVGGVGNALAAPAASGVLARHVPESRHGVAFGAMQAGAPFGAVFAGLALPAVAIPFGWRWAFVATAVLAAAAALAAPPAGRVRTAPVAADRRRGLSSVHALAVTAWLASSAGTGLVSFIVLYSIESGLSEGAAGLLLGALSVAAAGSRVALGLAVDRGGDPLRPVAVICASGQRAAVGASLVQRYGAREVIHVVDGGVGAWGRAGWPIER